MHIHRKSLYVFRFTADIAAILIAFISAANYFATRNAIELTTRDYFLSFSLILIWFFSARITNLYDEFRSRSFGIEFIGLIKNVLIQVIAAILILFLMKNHPLSRSFVLMYAIGSLSLVTFERFLLRGFLYLLRKRGRNLRNILIIGAGEVGQSFHESILTNPHFGYRLVGFLDDHSKTSLNGQYLGTIDQLEKMLTDHPVDDVIIALPAYAVEKIDEVIKTCTSHTTRVKIIPDYFRFISDKFEITMFDRFPVISVRKDKLDEMHWYVLKRAFDALFSLVMIVFFLSWLVPLIAIVIKLFSKGPVFFKQERWGRNNKKITCYKFRSMVSDSRDTNSEGKYQQATKNDPRITSLGKFLRKTNLDELPQFWNVLKGQMSVVGPRPHPTPLNMESKNIIDNYMLRHLVKPGITGWAQVNGFRGETKDPDLMQKRVNHDIWYIENWSFSLDVEIIFMTVWQMLKWDTKGY
ncbi:undecaprenyl-phosphate glucose phosphotransferase [bacterium]|nr:MAG: undecaprenyl-phosphate glucose phosphotransferase [bacterium]